MDTLRGLPEAVEAPDEFASSIEARDDALACLAASPGVGPPDLCWLQKSAKGAWSSTAAQPRGFYHFVLGRDTSGPAAVAAYFAEVTSLVEPMSFMQGLWYSSETKIERGFYCCFDPITRLDLRSELCIPGGVLCGALDAEGGVHEVTPELWRNCALASFLRSELYDPELTMHSEVLHRSPQVLSMRGEQAFLQSVIDMYAEGTLPQSIYHLTEDSGCGCNAEHMDLVLFTIFHYFGRQWRWQEALTFFNMLTKVHTAAAVYAASSQRELGSFEDSFNTLTMAVQRPQAMEQPSLLVALGMECLYGGQVQAAVNLARQAIQLAYTLRPAWLLLARCYIRMGELKQALVVLNLVPCPPHLLEDCQDILFTVAPPHQSITKPSLAYCGDPERGFAKRLAADAACTSGPILPGAVMVNREPLDMSVWPDVGPSRAPRAVLSSAYGLLQEIVSSTGWDGFLELRSRVFVMHAEAAQAVAVDPAAALEVGQIGSLPASSEGTTSHSGPAQVSPFQASGVQQQQQQQHPIDVFANATAAAAAAAQDSSAPSSMGPAAPVQAADQQGQQQGQQLQVQRQEAQAGLSADSGVIDLGSILSISDKEKGPSSSKPSTIQGSPSLWNAVFSRDTRPAVGASGAPRAVPTPSARPMGEGHETTRTSGEDRSTSTPGPMCESTEPSATGPGGQAPSAAPANGPQGTGDSHPSQGCTHGSLRASRSFSLQPLLKSVDSDREAVIFGCEDGLAQQGRVKRLCVRWLDELIIALWHDLQAYIEWKAQDSELLRLTGKSLAELTLELPGDVLPHSPAGNRSGAEVPQSLPNLPPGEWLQRGLLAERLCHDADALLAYRCCIKAGGFNLMALTAIMRLAAHCGEAVEAVRCCHAVLSWHCEQLPPPQSQQQPYKARPVPCPAVIPCCLRHLVARMGIDAVRTMVAVEVDTSAKVSGSRSATIKATFEKLLS
eukprot:CAMPEP_0202402262 /NCGR_PEP_ID=MMETSP1128-20130828/4106_1 /ASSEMBLY_ACC=CAM_ASM_000463 /TAXON_ID=3047 /ORGANISM="Dunaliella tertiolecta, Strain CCMP1320" /LENGTH=952 /DNA_ID=CAMNT_0049006267 /DNA_START=179 /DNA_END=3037 /DNA_ORIENTATION=+